MLPSGLCFLISLVDNSIMTGFVAWKMWEKKIVEIRKDFSTEMQGKKRGKEHFFHSTRTMG